MGQDIECEYEQRPNDELLVENNISAWYIDALRINIDELENVFDEWEQPTWEDNFTPSTKNVFQFKSVLSRSSLNSLLSFNRRNSLSIPDGRSIGSRRQSKFSLTSAIKKNCNNIDIPTEMSFLTHEPLDVETFFEKDVHSLEPKSYQGTQKVVEILVFLLLSIQVMADYYTTSSESWTYFILLGGNFIAFTALKLGEEKIKLSRKYWIFIGILVAQAVNLGLYFTRNFGIKVESNTDNKYFELNTVMVSLIAIVSLGNLWPVTLQTRQLTFGIYVIISVIVIMIIDNSGMDISGCVFFVLVIILIQYWLTDLEAVYRRAKILNIQWFEKKEVENVDKLKVVVLLIFFSLVIKKFLF